MRCAVKDRKTGRVAYIPRKSKELRKQRPNQAYPGKFINKGQSRVAPILFRFSPSVDRAEGLSCSRAGSCAAGGHGSIGTAGREGFPRSAYLMCLLTVT